MYLTSIICVAIIYFFIFNYFLNLIFKEKKLIRIFFINSFGLIAYGFFAYLPIFSGAIVFFSGKPTDFLIKLLGNSPVLIKLIFIYFIAFLPVLSITLLSVSFALFLVKKKY
ncbi:MAG: hypothetical protein RSD57_06750 [Comamonas sp.]